MVRLCLLGHCSTSHVPSTNMIWKTNWKFATRTNIIKLTALQCEEQFSLHMCTAYVSQPTKCMSAWDNIRSSQSHIYTVYCCIQYTNETHSSIYISKRGDGVILHEWTGRLFVLLSIDGGGFGNAFRECIVTTNAFRPSVFCCIRRHPRSVLYKNRQHRHEVYEKQKKNKKKKRTNKKKGKQWNWKMH